MRNREQRVVINTDVAVINPNDAIDAAGDNAAAVGAERPGLSVASKLQETLASRHLEDLGGAVLSNRHDHAAVLAERHVH